MIENYFVLFIKVHSNSLRHCITLCTQGWKKQRQSELAQEKTPDFSQNKLH